MSLKQAHDLCSPFIKLIFALFPFGNALLRGGHFTAEVVSPVLNDRVMESSYFVKTPNGGLRQAYADFSIQRT